MITYESVPQLVSPKPLIGPKYFAGNPCKKCGSSSRYIATGQCVICQRRMANARVEKYIPSDLDKQVAIELFKDGKSLQGIRAVLGCSANHLREYLGLPSKEQATHLRTYLVHLKKELQANAAM